MKAIRLYAADDGESRFETVEFALQLRDFAPPAAPLYVSDPKSATQFTLIELPVNWGGDTPHPSPRRTVLFCLSGSFQVTSSDGRSAAIERGDALILDDTKGKGHVTRVTSDVPVRAVMIARE